MARGGQLEHFNSLMSYCCAALLVHSFSYFFMIFHFNVGYNNDDV